MQCRNGVTIITKCFCVLVVVLGFLLFFKAKTFACGLPIIPMPTPLNAQASLDPFTGNPIIIVDPNFSLQVGAHGLRFTLAHECAHHALGHVVVSTVILQTNPLAMPWMTAAIELQADCQAAQTLASMGDMLAIMAGIQIVGSSGPFPSGPGYPTGFQRMQTVKSCAGIP